MTSAAVEQEAQQWTNPSVLALADGKDPVAALLELAERTVLEAREAGWAGPPFDPFGLARIQNVKVEAVDELDEARLVHVGRTPRIEYNPSRPPARVRFSVAHELGHLLFPDASEKIRYRAHGRERRGDDWQLELLCNLAAAEFLMPAGSFPAREAETLDINRLMALRERFEVSSEALLLRVARLTSKPSAIFAAARRSDQEAYRIDYVVPTRAWRPPISAGLEVEGPPLSDTTAIGHTAKEHVLWNGHALKVECVGIPSYPGDRYPRVVGVIRPGESVPAVTGIRLVHGDASKPKGKGPWIIAHLVNDKARRWTPYGFAGQLKTAFPDAHDEYIEWQEGRRHLGQVHVAEPEEDLLVCSMVGQDGYGSDRRDRVSYVHLRDCLRAVAQLAAERGAGVHIPLIGTGQAGGHWPTIRDLALEYLVGGGASVTAYVLPGAEVPEDEAEQQMALAT